MNLEERWAPVHGFRNYVANPLADIHHVSRPYKLLSHNDNGRGNIFVVIYDEGRRTSRGLARLILETFDHPADYGWVPYHRNHNYKDNYFANLIWRPRGYPKERAHELEWETPLIDRPIFVVEHDRVYDNSFELAEQIVGLEKSIHYQLHNPDKGYSHLGLTLNWA